MDPNVDDVHDGDSSAIPGDGQLPDSPGDSLHSGEPSGSAHVFRRAYKACDSCRQRKVRCDLGSVENPVEPPCRRCRRERRQCTFIHGLRGRARGGPASSGSRHALPEGGPINAYPSSERFTLAARSSAQPHAGHRPRTLPPLSSIAPQYATSSVPPPPPLRALRVGASPRTSYGHGHSHGAEYDARLPSQSGSNGRASSSSPTARASLALVSLSSSTEAIRVLAEQGTASPVLSSSNDPPARSDDDLPESGERDHTPSHQDEAAPTRVSCSRKRPYDAISDATDAASAAPPVGQPREAEASPPHRLRPTGANVPMATPPRPTPEMLDIWSCSGPVQRGMVTAEQAHYLVGYYFSHLHGFSPLCSERFIRFHCDVQVCTELALEEKLLLAAILAISSRYAHSDPDATSSHKGRNSTEEDPQDQEATSVTRMENDSVTSGNGKDTSAEAGTSPGIETSTGQTQSRASGVDDDSSPWTGGTRLTLQQHIDLSRWAYERSGHVLTNPSMHTIGTIEGLLILSEWGTWQMHDESTGGLGDTPRHTDETPNGPGHGRKEYSQEKDVLRRASGRYDSMVWLLVGCAVRLAEQLDLPKVEHVKCILDVGKEGQRRSSRSPPSHEELERAERRVQVWMSCVQIEASVSVRLGRRFTSAGLSPEWMELIRARSHLLPEEPVLRSTPPVPPAPPATPEERTARAEQERVDKVRREMVQANINLAFPDDLVGSAAAEDPQLNEYRKWVAWRGHAELAAKMRRTYELLYESESRSHNMIENDSFEGFLRPLRADLDHWVQWLEPKIGYPGGGMRAYNIRIHYHFTRLVLFRIGLDALVTRASKGTLDLRDGTGITDRAAFPMAKEAVDAARTLAIIISVDLASLRCAPPRIFLYLVLSVLLCMQAAELSDALMQPLQCASILRHAITALMNVSLDARHLSRVYAILLRKVGATVLKHEERLGQHHTLPPFSDPALAEKLHEARSRNQHRTSHSHRNSTVLRPRGQLHPQTQRPPKRRRADDAATHAALHPPPLPHSKSHDSVFPGPQHIAFNSAHVFPVPDTHAQTYASANSSVNKNSSTAGAGAGRTQTETAVPPPFWSTPHAQAQPQTQSMPSSRSNSSLPFFAPASNASADVPYQMTPNVPQLSPVLAAGGSVSANGTSPGSTGGPSPGQTQGTMDMSLYGAVLPPPPSFAGDIVPSVPRVEDILSFFGSVDETFNLLPDAHVVSAEVEAAQAAQAADAGALLGLSDADAARLAMIGGDPTVNSWPLLLNLNPALHN